MTREGGLDNLGEWFVEVGVEADGDDETKLVRLRKSRENPRRACACQSHMEVHLRLAHSFFRLGLHNLHILRLRCLDWWSLIFFD